MQILRIYEKNLSDENNSEIELRKTHAVLFGYFRFIVVLYVEIPFHMLYSTRYKNMNIFILCKINIRGIRTDAKHRSLTKIDLNVMHLVNLCKKNPM